MGRGCLGKGEKDALHDSHLSPDREQPVLTQGDSRALKFSAETKFIAVFSGEGRALMLAAAAAKGTGGRERAGEVTAGQTGTGALLGQFY